MTTVIITVKVMPETADVDLNELTEKATNAITQLGGKVAKTEFKPIAFGLQSLDLIFTADENKGTDEFEKALSELEGVQSAQVIDYRRALG